MYCRIKKPKRGVKSIVPSSGGTSPRYRFKYGSVICTHGLHSSHTVNLHPSAQGLSGCLNTIVAITCTIDCACKRIAYTAMELSR